MSWVVKMLEDKAKAEVELRKLYPNLSTRAIRLLVKFNWRTPGDLLAATDGGKDLYKFRGVGPVASTELTAWAYGLVAMRKGDVIRITPSREVAP